MDGATRKIRVLTIQSFLKDLPVTLAVLETRLTETLGHIPDAEHQQMATRGAVQMWGPPPPTHTLRIVKEMHVLVGIKSYHTEHFKVNVKMAKEIRQAYFITQFPRITTIYISFY